MLLAELPLDAPVVRHIERAPAGIVERHLLRSGHIAKVKPPAVIEALRLTLDEQQQDKKSHVEPPSTSSNLVTDAGAKE